MNAITDTATDGMRRASFSVNNPMDRGRDSGHQSRISSHTGSVTNIGLASRLAQKQANTSAIRVIVGALAYRAYAPIERNAKKALSTSFRSATHATDSTCSGCTAKIAATAAEHHGRAVMRHNTTKRTRVLRRCHTRLTR